MISQRLFLFGREIEYFIIKKIAFRNIRIKIDQTGRVIIFSPILVSDRYLEKILLSRGNWVIRKLKAVSEIKNIEIPQNVSLKKVREQARMVIEDRIGEINKVYNFSFSAVFLRDQKTRWGSCSSKKNLNFNYKIAFLPGHLRDYVIAHELCHLQEMNHSKRFWNLVEKSIPEWTTHRHELKKWRSS